MQVRVLGPLEVVIGEGVATPPGAGERSLLALLALRAGRVVPADQLVDALWGEALPANPQNALQLRVSKLRRWLASVGAPDGIVATRPPGYVLDLPAADVDALAVGEALSAARAATAGRPGEAVDLYRSVVDRWRGPALCDLPEADWTVAEGRRLEELRLAATEELVDAELALGRHRELLDLLDGLVAEHPLRERFHAQRMLALYRAGRQADALAAHQQLRGVLADELGLDPSSEVQALELAIIQQDPSIAAPAEPAKVDEAVPNLPAATVAVLGRDELVDRVEHLVAEHRVVTCTGPGGTGKTTLALEAARRMADRFRQAAWLVTLAATDDDEQVATQVAAAFRLPVTDALPGESDAARLARQLGSREALVVLDNCEHVLAGAATVTRELMARCPGIRVLATSREPLGVPGELRLPIPPLEVPEPDAGPSTLQRSPSVALFLDRARALDPGFEAAGGELEAVGVICRQLDGLPLAIELAAARTTVLSPTRIAERLGDQMSLLSSGPRTADDRHRTLRATVAWSHSMLSPSEQIVFRRLSVFRSPWELDAAEQVVSGDGVEPGEVLDIVASLVDRSLVARVAPGDGEPRFRMLETIRQFAEAELEGSGEGPSTTLRQVERLVAFAEEADRHLRTAAQVPWLRRIEGQLDDLRHALRVCEQDPDRLGVMGLRLATALGWFWYLDDHESGRRHLHRLLEVHEVPLELRARAWMALSLAERPSACIVHPGEVSADAARRATDAFEALGDRRSAALAQVYAAVEGIRSADPDAALAVLVRAERELEAADDDWGRALVGFVRMEILVRLGSGAEAIEHGERAAQEFVRLGDRWGLSAIRSHQSGHLRLLGRLDEAVEASRESLEVAREVGLHNNVQMVGAELGLLHARRGDGEAAHTELLAARAHGRRWGLHGSDAAVHLGHGHLARWDGHFDEAAAEYEEAARLAEGGVAPDWFVAEVHDGLGIARRLVGDIEGARAAHTRVIELAHRTREPRLLAVALEGFAGVAVAEGRTSDGAQLLGAAAAIRERFDRPADPLDRLDLDDLTARIDGDLPPGEREAAVESGRRLLAAAPGGWPDVKELPGAASVMPDATSVSHRA